ncbi:hypothetical protein OJ998_00750 [Solirubrobacter taibaiensis]|nr:hypothetical protein [Solirubrobacter taibaiensis]
MPPCAGSRGAHAEHARRRDGVRGPGAARPQATLEHPAARAVELDDRAVEAHVEVAAGRGSRVGHRASSRSNPEIAAERFVGRRTVEMHLARAYRASSGSAAEPSYPARSPRAEHRASPFGLRLALGGRRALCATATRSGATSRVRSGW